MRCVSAPLRALYVDLDNTLLGAGGSLLLDGEANITALGVRAIEAALRAGAEVVPITGRRQAGAREAARLLGARAYVFECGSAVVLDGEEHWLTGDYRPGEPTIHEQIAATSAPNLLLAAYHDRLEHHAPWHRGREVSHLFRGLVDTAAATALLAQQGHGDLRLLDNGRAVGDYPSLDGLEQVRVYHLLPAGASKADGVAFHREARGLEREATIAVGDSPEDLACATEVDRLWLVANAISDDPTMRHLAAGLPNVRVAEEGHGPGVYEAVITELAQRR
jgi:hydroxymethylpyrimidine pyrophosphatase-like HAD family hydrolase